MPTRQQLEKSYRPPQVTQYGIDATLDDCRVVAVIHGIADATLGESVTNRFGYEKTLGELHGLARRMRRNLRDDDKMTPTDAREMATDLGYPDPGVIDITKSQMLADLKARKRGFSVSGNPSKIKGTSALKRCDCNHEWYLSRANVDGSKILVFDGLRKGPKRAPKRRGEWVATNKVWQMVFKANGKADNVIPFPIGGWTRERRATKRVRAERLVFKTRLTEAIYKIEHKQEVIEEKRDIIEVLRVDLDLSTDRTGVLEAIVAERDSRIEELELETSDTSETDRLVGNARAAGREEALVQVIENTQELRTS